MCSLDDDHKIPQLRRFRDAVLRSSTLRKAQPCMHATQRKACMQVQNCGATLALLCVGTDRGDHAKQIGQWCGKMSAARQTDRSACKYAALKIAALRTAILHLHACMAALRAACCCAAQHRKIAKARGFCGRHRVSSSSVESESQDHGSGLAPLRYNSPTLRGTRFAKTMLNRSVSGVAW